MNRPSIYLYIYYNSIYIYIDIYIYDYYVYIYMYIYIMCVCVLIYRVRKRIRSNKSVVSSHQRRQARLISPSRCTKSTWWLIPLSKWVISPLINGISRVNPLTTGVITCYNPLTKWDEPPSTHPVDPGTPWDTRPECPSLERHSRPKCHPCASDLHWSCPATEPRRRHTNRLTLRKWLILFDDLRKSS